ncbi:MAG: amidohydrolase [Clostridiaceae bacterium]|nr:amidohydrolase [Clostridiaceae bacterium]
MLLIKNGRILTMAGPIYENGSILIDNKKIIKIGEEIDADENVLSEVIDASGCWVLPGLIESHCHVGIIEERKGFEGDDCNERNEPITPYLKAIDAINPMDSAFHNALSAGITGLMVGPGSSNVVGGQFAFIKTYGRSIDKMVVLEPAAMKIAFGENPKSNYDNKNKMPTTRMAIGAMLREELFEAKKYYIKKQNAKKNGDSFDEDFRKECWIPVLEKKIPLKAHVHRVDDILTAIRIAREYDLDLTLDHCTEGHLIAKEIKKSGFPAIIGPSLSTRNKIETKNADFKTPGILNKEGVTVAIMTDHPVTRIQDLVICAAFAAREGLGVEEGLKAITINAAKICRVDDRIGSLEVGKDADIAIFDGHPMDIFTRTLYTIINGEIVYRAKDMKSQNHSQ